jgi:ParB family transcriptional regulator, chromosome partitioning protein
MEVQAWPLAKIKVAERVRRNLGDLDDLKASMSSRGLINPVGVTAEGVLVTGERRLTAARELGWETIDARVYRDASDLELLDVEVEENTCRKALTPGEAERRYQARKKLLTETGIVKMGRPNESTAICGTFSSQSRNDRTANAQAAKGTGFGERTLDKVAEVRETAENPAEDPEVREEAKRQHDALMEGTAKPDPAAKAVEAAKRRSQRKQAKLSTGLGPGQWIEPAPVALPGPTISQRLVDAISKGQKLADIAAEIQDADLDLNSDVIETLRKRLTREIKERQELNRALKGVLDKRKV